MSNEAPHTIRLPKMTWAPAADELSAALSQLKENEGSTIELSWAFAGSPKWYKLAVEYEEGNPVPLWTMKQSDGLEIKRIWTEYTENVVTVHSTVSRLSGAPPMRPGSQSGGFVNGSQSGRYPKLQSGAQSGAQSVYRPHESPGQTSTVPSAAANPKELLAAEEGALEHFEHFPNEESELEFLGEDGTGASQLASQIADPRTGLAGFGAMLKYVDVEVNRFQQYGNPVSLVVFSVCGTDEKPLPINAVTSLVLRVQVLKRRLDVAGHLEGDLYALLLPNTKLGKAVLLCSRLREALTATPLAPGLNKNTLKLSFGIATIPDHCCDLATLIAQAKSAMAASVASYSKDPPATAERVIQKI